MKRCQWVTADPIYVEYHDQEWGVAVHDDRRLFEMINLEGAQAGLSWITILKKRKQYRLSFDSFDPLKIIHYNDSKIQELMENAGIIRNQRKIAAVIENAKAYLQILEDYGSFDSYLWRFVDGKPLINHWTTHEQVPVTTPLSEALSKDLKKHGFKFVGGTICYSFMQAVGMVMDHTVDCFRYNELLP
ncbi:MAG TPA: DNA-3-methyladenine glycosylase I [Bacillota bacterium]|nr:DNA-3-methyladenine glycosylase I [Bacillota bacterium]